MKGKPALSRGWYPQSIFSWRWDSSVTTGWLQPGPDMTMSPCLSKISARLVSKQKINHRSPKSCSQPSQSETLVHVSKNLCPLSPANFQREFQHWEAHTGCHLLRQTLSLLGHNHSFSAEWFVLAVLSPHTPDGDNVPLGGF